MKRILNDKPGFIKRAEPFLKDADVETITFDLDGVITKTTSRVLELFRQEGGMPLDFKGVTDYNLQKFLRYKNGDVVSDGHLRYLFKKAWSEPNKIERQHRNTRALINGGPLGGYKKDILTSTWADEKYVLEFLKINRLCFDELIMVDSEKEKVEQAGNFHLDDNTGTAIAISKAGKYSFILKSPYTPPFQKINDHIFLVRDWSHFGRMLSSGVYLKGMSDVQRYEGVYIPPLEESERYSSVKDDIQRGIRNAE